MSSRWRTRSLATVMLALMLEAGADVTAEVNDAPLPVGVKRLSIPGVQNAFAIGTNLFSGSTPETEESFSALQRLGIKTIISVDGAPPNANAARKHGIRYVHLPCGYDGIATNRQQQLAKAVATLPGPIFVHCHHGSHRGPAAAAIMALANQQWTTNIAEAWLHTAGTGTNYLGLYASVRDFRNLAVDPLPLVPGEFPERAPSAALVDAMVELDRCWENLKAIRSAGSSASASSLGSEATKNMTLLREHFREAQRLPESTQYGPAFVKALRDAEAQADVAAQLLKAGAPLATLAKALDAVRVSCTDCHRTHRDK